MNLIFGQLGKAIVPILIKMVLDNMDEIHKFLSDKAKLTDNKLDDHIVDIACEFLVDFLKEEDK